MLVQGAVEEETHCTGRIFEINLSQNDITSEGVKHLSHLPKQRMNKLETLACTISVINWAQNPVQSFLLSSYMCLI